MENCPIRIMVGLFNISLYAAIQKLEENRFKEVVMGDKILSEIGYKIKIGLAF